MCGLFEVKPETFLLPSDEITTFADTFGARTQHWNGVDVTINARMDNGLVLQGGISSGRTSSDSCELNANLNNPSPLYCATETPFLTQVKFLGSYPLPHDIQLSGTLQSLPGREVLVANVTYNRRFEVGVGRHQW